MVCEFAKLGVEETEDDRRKRQQRNQRRISEQEKRLREVAEDVLPSPPAGSSQRVKAYSTTRVFEVEQMTYAFSFCEVCKERRMECKAQET